MAHYLISLIRPDGYLHSECLREAAETLHFGLGSLGHTAAILENIVDPQAVNILLGAHLLTPEDAAKVPPGSILYNLEQLAAGSVPASYAVLARRCRIWDYSPLNLGRWPALEAVFPPVLAEIGYVPELRRIPSGVEQDIDVLFYGSVNERRRRILQDLEAAGCRVHAVFGVYGRERDALIARSKIVLNVHHYEEAGAFESVRVSYLLTNSKAVVTETSPDMAGYRKAVAAFSYGGLVEGCVKLLRDQERRKALEARGFAWFSRRGEAKILSQALSTSAAGTAAAMPPAPPAGVRKAGQDATRKTSPDEDTVRLRRLYLDMVQNCVINLIYEDPNQDRWSPHRYNGQLREMGRDWPSQAHSMIGNRRMANVRRIVERVIEERIPGDLIETGVWRGGACIMMRAVLAAYGVGDRNVWVADSFCGLPRPDPRIAADAGDCHHTFSELAIPLEEVQANFRKYGLLDGQVRFLKGWFSETLPQAPIERLAVLRLDGDMYGSTMDALEALYGKLSPGGFLIVDDFGAVAGCREAVQEFRSREGIAAPIEDIDGYGVFWRKPYSAPEAHAAPHAALAAAT